MRVRGVIRQRGRSRAVVGLLAALVVGFAPQGAVADISAESYCKVAMQSMQQEVSQLQEAIALANGRQPDLGTLAEVNQAERAERDRAKDALFASFGITAQEYVTYTGKHKAAVDKYLAENPAVKERIDSLSAQLRSLLEQYESQRGSLKNTP